MIETPVFGTAAVAAPHRMAAETGRIVLAQGGNAIEAMVAMASTIAVVYPHMNSIGGDGFWIIADRTRKIRVIQACGPAGARATIQAYREKGYDTIPPQGVDAALTVPGAIGGWQVALDMAKAFGGRLPLATLLGDAIRHAREGVPVSASETRTEAHDYAGLKAVPGFAAIFMPDGKSPELGAPLVQRKLADTFEQLAHQGLDDFYRGDIGREMASDLDRIGSPVTRDDLNRYEARLREPLMLPIEGGRVFNAPPPTQGLATLIVHGIFERLKIAKPESFEHIHGLIEAVKRAMLVRRRVITDPVFLDHDPADFLTDAFLAEQTGKISMTRAAEPPPIEAKGDTIWMGAIDREGLAVSYIQSVFWSYGSGVVLPSTGVLMHNRGASFSLDPKSRNPLTPGRLPFHTLNPAVVLFDDGRVMPFGTMGGDAQAQILGQNFSRLRFGVGLAEAIDAPRFVLGKPWGTAETALKLENRFDDSVVRRLIEAGHPVVIDDAPYSDFYGHSGVLVRHPQNGRIEATHDPRSDGAALGL